MSIANYVTLGKQGS